MFKKPVEHAVQGDRIGICLTQFDPKQLERGIACKPGYVPTIAAAIISVQKIKYFKGNVNTKAKFHVSIGHETVMAKLSFFGLVRDSSGAANDNAFDFEREYKFQDELLLDLQCDSQDIRVKEMPVKQFALLEFEKPVLSVPKCLIIGSKLDTDIQTSSCRLAFWGHLLEGIEDKNYSAVLPRLKIYKEKCKRGVIDRASNQYEVIGKNMFKKETNIQLFVGLQVELSTGEVGVIESSFGQSGKVKIRIPGWYIQTNNAFSLYVFHNTQAYTNIKKNISLRKDSNGIQKGRHINDLCTSTAHDPLCSPPAALYLQHVQYRVNRDVFRVTWMHKMTTQLPEP